MSIVTVSWLMNFESNMQVLVENEYAAFSDPANTWWDLIARRKSSMSARELLAWFISTAQLYDQGQGGNVRFQDPVMLQTEFTNKTAGAGLRLKKQQFDDLDGHGIDAATKWASDMGAQFGYWPQLKIAELLKAGEAGTGYDARPFFDTAHPNNGLNTQGGTFSNLLTGAGFRIDSNGGAISLETAARNLASVYKAIRSVKMPNGKQVRMLRPAGILCGPALYPRAAELLGAKFIGSAAGGSTDISGYVSRMGYGKVTEAPELVESEYDTSYYVAVEMVGRTDLGALVYVEREAYNIRYYTGQGGGVGVDAILGRADELEWQASGRNIAGYGHPFLLFKVKAA